MKLIPTYRVSYHGKFYEAGKAFPIEAEDREEMEQHGRVTDARDEAPVKNGRGRPPKEEKHDEPGEDAPSDEGA